MKRLDDLAFERAHAAAVHAAAFAPKGERRKRLERLRDMVTKQLRHELRVRRRKRG